MTKCLNLYVLCKEKLGDDKWLELKGLNDFKEMCAGYRYFIIKFSILLFVDRHTTKISILKPTTRLIAEMYYHSKGSTKIW